MTDKITTIEALAEMIQRNVASKHDVETFRTEVHERFDKIEHLMYGDYKHRIEQLETDMKKLKDALAV